MENFIKVNSKSLNFYGILVSIIKVVNDTSTDEGNVVSWHVPYSASACDLLISYDFRTNELEILEIEETLDLPSNTDENLAYTLIGAANVHGVSVSYNDTLYDEGNTDEETSEEMQTINQAIHTAFYIGDQDECFAKYIGHTLSAIYVGNGFQNPVDYRSPSCESTDDLTELNNLWEEVEKVCQKVGKEKFRELASSNHHAEYFDDDYIEMAERFNNENIMEMKTLKMIDNLSKEDIQELINEVKVQLAKGRDMNELFPSLSYSSLSSKCDYQMLQEIFDINPVILMVAGFYEECSIERLKIFNQFDTNLLTSMKEDGQCPDHTLKKISIILQD